MGPFPLNGIVSGKRIRVDDFVPLPGVLNNDDHIPRYLIASSLPQSDSIETKPLSSYNVFQMEKGLNYISRDYLDITEMRSGDLMIKTTNMKSAQKFLKAKYIDTVPVKIEMHKTLNSIQGRIFSRKIIDIPENEIIKSLEDQKVIDIRKLTRKEGNNFVPTGAAVITFDLIHRPDILKIGWERVRVEEYISNPMRCVNCQKLGHTRNRCKNIELCRECGYVSPHEQCIRKFCVNCNSDTHTSYDSSCPSFIKHKSVNKIKSDKRCTVREAWKVFNENPHIHTIKPFNKKTPTYSEIIQNNLFSKNQTRNNNQSTTTNSNLSTTTNIISKPTTSTKKTSNTMALDEQIK